MSEVWTVRLIGGNPTVSQLHPVSELSRPRTFFLRCFWGMIEWRTKQGKNMVAAF